MTLDELILTLTNIREHVPGETVVRIEAIVREADRREHRDIHTVRFSPGQDKPVVISESTGE